MADFSRPQSLEEVIVQSEPRVVINCAAWTAVDAAEESPQDCHCVNADAVFHIAKACNEIDATLVQVSTDYVFGQIQSGSIHTQRPMHPVRLITMVLPNWPVKKLPLQLNSI